MVLEVGDGASFLRSTLRKVSGFPKPATKHPAFQKRNAKKKSLSRSSPATQVPSSNQGLKSSRPKCPPAVFHFFSEERNQPLRSISSTGSSKGAPLLPLVFLELLRSHTNEGVGSSQFMRTRHFHFFRLLLFNGFHHFHTWTQMKLTFRPGEKSSLLVTFESSRKRNKDRNQKQTKMEKDFSWNVGVHFVSFFGGSFMVLIER